MQENHREIIVHGFTAKYNKIVTSLKTETKISQAFNPSQASDRPQFNLYNCLWDTGATNTVITKKVVTDCNLKPIDIIEVHHAKGTSITEVYLVNIILRNNVMFHNLRVIEGTLQGDIDVLIGMDIITQGDFAITNHNGQTTFSFRIPSIETIDFRGQEHANTQLQIKKPKTPPFAKPATDIGRNALCPCGSGRKHKKCCGSNLS